MPRLVIAGAAILAAGMLILVLVFSPAGTVPVLAQGTVVANTPIVPARSATPTVSATAPATNTAVPVPTDTPVPSTPVPPAPSPTGAGGGQAVLPPSTGTGDAAGGSSFGPGFLAAGIALVAFGGGSILAGVRRRSR